ncbi:hypothetical protein HN615_06670 [Candidatus Woesearchaeota archaeon]|jgi:hypothetical protein|nr:hypothetical protein [Candidatus Woesearchaeota archaeon]
MDKGKLQEKIKHFLDIVEKNIITNPLSNKPLYENGLVVFENNNSDLSARDVFEILPKGKGVFITINNPHDYGEFIKTFSITNREGQWLIIDLQCDPHPKIIGALKKITEDNETVVSDFKGKELSLIKLNSKTRIVFCANRLLIEDKISYPYFYNIFGPILNL